MTETPRQVIKYYKQSTRSQAIQWYREEDNLHSHIFNAVDQIKRVDRANINSKYLALYENVDGLPGLSPSDSVSLFSSKLTFNVIRSVIDTGASKIAVNRPRPEFNTINGDFRLQRTAKLLTQFNDGIYYDNDTYPLIQDCFLDAQLWGTAAVQVFAANNTVKHERVRIEEIHVDETEAQYGKPRNLYHERKLYRDLLLERAYNEGWSTTAIQAIQDAPATNADTESPEMIRVIEAWHLPTKDKKGKTVGGRRAVVIENHTLDDSEYTLTSFPFVFFKWANPRIGFYGKGLAEELVPIQWEISQVLKHISRHMRQTGLKIIVPLGADINPSHLASTNIPVIEADLTLGTPTGLTFPAVSQETYQYLNNLVEQAYQLSGVSQAQASSQKEPGITAAAAMNAMADMQTERFGLKNQAFEQFSLDIADLTIQTAKQLFTSPDFEWDKTQNHELAKEIDWKKNDIADCTYRLQCFPVAAFSTGPQARMQQAQDWVQNGIMPPKRAVQIMGDNPDYREWQTLETASLNRVQKYLDLMKHDNVYNPPDRYLDLPEAIELANGEINRSITEDVPDSHIQLMRQFIDECEALAAEQSAQNAPPAAPDASPLAQGAPPPESGLMPFQG